MFVPAFPPSCRHTLRAYAKANALDAERAINFCAWLTPQSPRAARVSRRELLAVRQQHAKFKSVAISARNDISGTPAAFQLEEKCRVA